MSAGSESEIRPALLFETADDLDAILDVEGIAGVKLVADWVSLNL